MNKLVVLATLFAAAMAAQLPAYSKPSYLAAPAAYSTPSPAYQKPSSERSSYSKPAGETHPMMPFSFAYEVKDDPTSQDFSHKENSDGKAITGSYRVILPDSRIQIVTYKADENGYVADVQYEGEAKYDEYKPAVAPAYSKPDYSAEPAYPEPDQQSTYSKPAAASVYTKPANPGPSSYAKAAHPKPAYPKPINAKSFN